MARRSAPSQPKPADITPEKMRAAIPRLEKRIAELQAFNSETINDRSDPRISALEQAIDETLAWIFDADTVDYNRYRGARRLDRAGHQIGYETPIYEVRAGIKKGVANSISVLEGIIKRFHEELDPAVGRAQEPDSTPQRAQAHSRRVFVVHGHDEAAREAVARFLEKIDLKPIILHEQPSQGRTIIEKVEAHGDVGFVVVLLTPDDVGGPNRDQMQRRPRQNVLLELGYFIGRLGRSRVCALKRGEMEFPTDFAGVVWETFDDTGGWKQKLGRELQAAGFEIDWNKVMRS